MGRVYCRQLNIHRNICENTKHIWRMLTGAKKWGKRAPWENKEKSSWGLLLSSLPLPTWNSDSFPLQGESVAGADATNASVTVTEERSKFRVQLQFLQQELPSFPHQGRARPRFSWKKLPWVTLNFGAVWGFGLFFFSAKVRMNDMWN